MTTPQSHLLKATFGSVHAGTVDAGAETLTGTTLGALALDKEVTVIVTTGAATATLADGLRVGQKKVIVMKTDGGNCVLTPANLVGGTTVTFDDAGDYANLLWDGANWVSIGATATIA